MKENPPALVRFILAVDRTISALGRILVIVRAETAWMVSYRAERERTNRALYDGFRTFYPGGETFEGGLFGWERDALAPPFPTTGRILIGAAGVGREMIEMARLGHEVVAFEPAPALAEAAQKVAAVLPGCTVERAAYADLIEAAESGTGPLAAQVCGRQFSGVILGWISFSYVWREDREALLKALRTLAPRAPVLLSYMRPDGEAEGRAATFRAWFRKFLSFFGGANRLAEPGDSFLPWMGFYQTITTEGMLSLAERTGYRAIRVNAPDAGYALLEPVRILARRRRGGKK